MYMDDLFGARVFLSTTPNQNVKSLIDLHKTRNQDKKNVCDVLFGKWIENGLQMCVIVCMNSEHVYDVKRQWIGKNVLWKCLSVFIFLVNFCWIHIYGDYFSIKTFFT